MFTNTDAGRRVARRRPARGDLRRRAPGRDRGARNEDRPGRDPPAQLHQPVPVRDAGRAHLRHRRLRGDAQPRARDGRRQGLRGAQGGERTEAACCAGSATPATSRPAGIAPSNIAGALGARAGLFEAGEVRVHPTGKVTVFTGSHSHGQGHETTFAQVVADRLGIALEDVDIQHGDTGKIAVRHGHLRLALDRGRRHRDRQGARQGDREGQEDRRASAGGERERHRVHERRVQGRRHRPQEGRSPRSP